MNDLLRTWEEGIGELPAERAQALLRLSLPDHPAAELAGMTIGQRDEHLFDVRACTFGRRVVGLAACPECGAQAELDFDSAAVRVTGGSGARYRGEDLHVSASGYDVRFRLPTVEDLLAAAVSGDPEEARRSLLSYAVLDALDSAGQPVDYRALPTAVVDLIDECLAEADPLADIRLALTCPNCSNPWAASLDIAGFFWSELDAWASRLLFEVHLLATAYAWSEADILALSPTRRRLYLEAVSG